jgi:hypothetical protein
MNPGPGNNSMIIRRMSMGLWLSCLLLPLSALAEQLPGSNPWAISSPYQQTQHKASEPAASNSNLPQNKTPQAATDNFSPPRPARPLFAPPRWAYPPVPVMPGYQPPQTQPKPYPQQFQASRPYLETSIDSTDAYVHQNLVMTIRVISTANLQTAVAQLQDNDDVIFRQLGNATVTTRNRQGRQEIVRTLYYQLTPLRSGRIELQPVRVTGVIENNTPGAANYEAVASQPVQLMVSDPVSTVQPWLPLHELKLSASLSNDEKVGEGEPLTLTVVQRAVGMSGAQLPSLEEQLQAPGHRLYRENSDYEGTITLEGQLVGTRTDRYTLVPLEGNRVEIPAIGVDWWNVGRQRKETAVLPGRFLNARDRQPGENEPAGVTVTTEAGGPLLAWLVVIVIAFLLGRFWTRLTPAVRDGGRWFWQWLDTVSQPLQRQVAAVLVHLSPQRNLHLLRRTVADNLPRSARLWFCVRSADEEHDVNDWSQVLRFLINRRLGMPAQLPMAKLAEYIIEIHPGANPDKIRSLLSELEAALFAGQDMQDFESWKKEFKRQVRPRLFVSLRRSQRDLRVTGLPGLNPTIS